MAGVVFVASPLFDDVEVQSEPVYWVNVFPAVFVYLLVCFLALMTGTYFSSFVRSQLHVRTGSGGLISSTFVAAAQKEARATAEWQSSDAVT